MMELIFLAIGFILGVGVMASTVRRAKQKPEGRSAKLIAMLSP